MSETRGVKTVEGYLSSLVAHDWDEFGTYLADDVVRIGPFGDTYTGRPEYVSFLSDLMPRLAGYEMRVHRMLLTAASDVGGDVDVVVVELSETVEIDGAPKVTPECLVFELDGRELITKISIYISA